ncbi:unnamed protein product [Paramecium sonneborni]|uniref:Uncharacterized protein n=1 Tax=Paramecium sonneborni TaxID=65129 RepID=A0A8S1L2I9_9CILI|nr:unnamed protein product [Paramecium sonneborni]
MKALILLLLGLSAYAFTEQMMSLEELANFNVKTMDCSRSDQFSFIEKQMKQWEDLLIHQKAISHDIKILEQMEKMLTTKHHSFLEAQVKVSGKKLLKKLHKLELPLTKSKIGLSQVKALREQCHGLDSENHEDRTAAKKELCRLLREYINSLNNCRQQCRSTPITLFTEIENHILNKNLQLKSLISFQYLQQYSYQCILEQQKENLIIFKLYIKRSQIVLQVQQKQNTQNQILVLT